MTKSFQIFDGKIRSLKQHLQLIDLSLTLACKCCNKEKDNGKNIATTLHAVSGTHLQLNIPNKTTDIKRTFAYSRRKLNEQAIIELYRLFSDYISNIVSELFKNNPYQLFGAITDKNERALFYHEIIQLSSYDAIIEEISKRIYRSFEKQRSTPKLLEKIISTTKVRNVDEKFKRMDKDNKIHITGKKLNMTYDLANASMNAVFKLCKSIDDQLIHRTLVSTL